jgi:uncharacterized membrane protein YfcA
MDIWTIAGLAAAAVMAGAINAIAGGGSLISFPALVAAGYPAKVANVTNTVAIWPGTIAGSFAYRAELGRRRRRLLLLIAPSVVGASAGSLLLLLTPEGAFDAIVPFLILFACLLLALQTPMRRLADHHRLGSVNNDDVPLTLHAAIFLAAVYGAYFGAGLGIMTLAFLSILVPDDIQHANALKGLLAMLINGLAAAYFAVSGLVEWGPVVVMALGAVAGGYLGVSVARRFPAGVLRASIVAYGVVVAVVLLIE